MRVENAGTRASIGDSLLLSCTPRFCELEIDFPSLHHHFARCKVTIQYGTLVDMRRTFQLRWILLLFGIGAQISVSIRASRAEDEDLKHWSFRSVKTTVSPTVRDPAWVASPVDAFVLAKLEAQGLRPSSPAERRTLIRRVTFDLTGLPPTLDEIDAFLADKSAEAFSKVVARLLESPAYGERWGRHWLDVVRYADARDLIQLPAESDFREAWRYRDWVVASFNRDLPYDQFIRQQVAGDLMQPNDPTRIDADAFVATGLLAIADFVPGDVDKQQMIADYVNDQIDVVGRAILGLTIACARCHDHKFDAITTEDYYALAGIFFSTRLIPSPVKGNTPLVRVPLLPQTEITAIETARARDQQRLVELTRDVANFDERQYRSYLEQLVESKTDAYLLAIWDFLHPAAAQESQTLDNFATTAGLDATILTRWKTFLEQPQRDMVLSDIETISDRTAVESRTRELTKRLADFAVARRTEWENDPIARTLGESCLVQLRSNDRHLVANEAHQATSWPNHGRVLESAIPVIDVPPPAVASCDFNGCSQAVLKFTGKELLQFPRSIPEAGSLVVAFRPDPNGTAGQRLVGWEDAAVGQHGLGIMSDAAGSLHVIVRCRGTSGDVVVPAPASPPSLSGFQTVCVTWGPLGVAVYRDGESVGTNTAIHSVSSDPAITALRIGGPGSGASSRFQGDLAELRVYDVPQDAEARTRIEREIKSHWLDPAISPTPNAVTQTSELYHRLTSEHSPFRLEPSERDKSLSVESRKTLAAMRDELETLKKKPTTEIPNAVVVQEGGPADTPHEGFRDAHVYLRGNHLNLGPIVPRGVPKALEGANPPAIKEGSGRRELAEWLTRPDNPLTARVMVNRIWQHHFGVGLVPTSANFGAMGDDPSHPELLDFLAGQFVASGWSIKAMHRLIMLSNVYQQSSAANPAGLATDPENRWLWRANRRRLEAEAFRDSLFAVSGKLERKSGGQGFLDAAQPYRSLYLMSVRTGAKSSEIGPLFDAPDCSGIVERRNESIVAPQALFLMNDPLVQELATVLSDRIVREVPTGPHHQRIERLYQIALGRLPSNEEVDIGMKILDDQIGIDSATTTSWSGYCRLVVSTNEFMFVD